MNFLKAYKEKIEGAPNYDDDYIYYLVDRFIKDYIPNVIEECIMTKNTKVEIAYRDIEKFLREIMFNDIAQGVRDGKINGVTIPDTTTKEIAIVSDSNNSCLGMNRNDISLENYVNRFNSYIPLVLTFISFKLPFSSKEGRLETDLMSFIDYYYVQEQCDDILRPLTPKEESLKEDTGNIFKEQILFGLIPNLIESMKEKNRKKLVVQYSIDRGVVKFGDLEFSGVDLREFGKCINLLPAKDITDYSSRSKDKKIENVYKFEFTLQELETLYSRAQQVVSQEETIKTR